MRKLLAVSLICILFLAAFGRFADAAAPSLFDKPMKPSRNLVLENVREAGAMVDISTYYGKDGKPLLLVGICPE